jgi:hypothetical protein
MKKNTHWLSWVDWQWKEMIKGELATNDEEKCLKGELDNPQHLKNI